MIHHRCPHCGRALSNSPGMAGQRTACRGCRGEVCVPEPTVANALPPRDSAPKAAPAAKRPNGGVKRLLMRVVVGVAAAGLLGLIGFIGYSLLAPQFTAKPNVHVDNSSDAELQVRVDGKEWATCPAGSSAALLMRVGEHHLTVLRAGKPVDSLDVRVKGGQVYILNLLRKQKYQVGSVQYAEDTPLFGMGGGQPSPKEIDDAWIEPTVDHLFEMPPSSVRVRRGQTQAAKTYLIRSPPPPSPVTSPPPPTDPPPPSDAAAVYVENYSGKDLRVRLDGQDWLTCKNGTNTRVNMPPGAHRLVVFGADDDIADALDVFALSGTRYVFNLLRSQKYHSGTRTYNVQDQLGVSSKNREPPATVYDAGWIEVPAVNFFFTEPPEKVGVPNATTPTVEKTYFLRGLPPKP